MRSKEYKVKRDDVYVGSVIKTGDIYRWTGTMDHHHTKHGQLYAPFYKHYRSMLFVPDDNNRANDLLYRSKRYPVLNITDDETCLNAGKDSVVIQNATNISELLKYYGYDEILTYEDILEIRKYFFTGHFVKENEELFVKGAEYKAKYALPSQYFDILKSMGDKSLLDVIFGFDKRMNAFVPAKEEGKIKKLKRGY